MRSIIKNGAIPLGIILMNTILDTKWGLVATSCGYLTNLKSII